MPLVDPKAPIRPTTRRWFGLSLGVLLAFIGWLVGHSSGSWAMPVRIIVWFLAVGLVATYYAIPASQITIIRLWQYLTLPLAWTVGHLLLLLAFYGVFLPIGLVLRFLGYDPLKLRQTDSDSDWMPREAPKSLDQYFKQF